MYDAKRYTPDPVTGPILATLYDRYIAGESFNQIANSLNREGIPSQTGRLWWVASLIITLDSGFAAGYVKAYGGLQPGAHEPVITPEVWQAYQRKRRHRRRMPARTIAAAHPYAGLVRCGAEDIGVDESLLSDVFVTVQCGECV